MSALSIHYNNHLAFAASRMSEKVEFTPIKVDEDATLNPQEVNKSQRRRNIIIAAIVVAVIVLVIVAFVVGYFVRRASKPGCEEQETHRDKQETGDLESQHKEAVDGISEERIQDSLKYV